MNRIINILFDDYNEYEEYFQENNRRRARLIRPRTNYLEIFDNVHFKERFIISKDNFMMLLERIQGQIQHLSNRYV